jgi:hypothetical protein
MVAFPRYDAVIVTTGAVHRSDACSGYLMPALRRHAPSIFAEGSSPADGRLADRLKRETGPEQMNTGAQPEAGIAGLMRFRAEPNELGVEGFEFRIFEDKCVLQVEDSHGTHTVLMGINHWIEGETSMSGARLHHGYEWTRARVVASARWLDGHTLEMVWIFVETSFRDRLVCRFEGTRARLERTVNVNSGKRESPELVASRIQ